MAIRVDADACPDILIVENLSKKYQIDLFLYFDFAHQIQSSYATCILCDTSFQSVDMKIIKDIHTKDLVITQDYGLAVLAIGKGAYVLNPKGFYYTLNTIDTYLMERHIHSRTKHRRGPKRRKKMDIQNFSKQILIYIEREYRTLFIEKEKEK